MVCVIPVISTFYTHVTGISAGIIRVLYWDYGNMGYEEFNGGTKNQFHPKHDHTSRKNSYLEKWISMD